jgi:hypothetical protein
VLAYLSRYTHRVAISNRRLIAFGGRQVTFKVKDYRIEGPGRYTTMTLDVDEFIRRFLIHVLPKGFHRIHHYGPFAGSNRAKTIADVLELLNLDPPAAEETSETDPVQPIAHPCPCCGGPHVHHRDFRARLSAASSAERASRRNQDRYLMIANTISRIIVSVSRRSSTGNAAARPDRRPALHVTLNVSLRHGVSAALSNPITRSGARNHKVLAHRRLLLDRRATIKSP